MYCIIVKSELIGAIGLTVADCQEE